MEKQIILTIVKTDGNETTFSMKEEDLDIYHTSFISFRIRRFSNGFSVVKRPQTVETVYIPWHEIKQLIVQEDEDGNE